MREQILCVAETDEPLKFFVSEDLSPNGDESGVETITLLCNRPCYAKKLFSETILSKHQVFD